MKSQPLIFIVFLFVLVVLTGCQNDKIGPTTVHGRVVNAITGEPQAGAKILAQRMTGGLLTPGGLEGDTHLGETWSDAKGEFYFRFKGGGSGYDHEVIIDNDFGDTTIFFKGGEKAFTHYEEPLSIHEDNEIEFRVVPQAYLNLIIHNVNYFDEKDSLHYTYGNPAIGWGDGVHFNFTGNFHHESGNGPAPMGWIVFNWDVTRNGQTTYYQDSIWCKSGSANTFTINY